MKKPISLWIFGITGIICDLLSMAVFFMVFIMLAQYNSFFIPFITITILLLLLLIVSSIEMFKLKRGGKNIFIFLTLAMNIFLFIYLLAFPVVNVCFAISLLVFIAYFLNPSIRKLFN